jgi:hypothetical protein
VRAQEHISLLGRLDRRNDPCSCSGDCGEGDYAGWHALSLDVRDARLATGPIILTIWACYPGVIPDNHKMCPRGYKFGRLRCVHVHANVVGQV